MSDFLLVSPSESAREEFLLQMRVVQPRLRVLAFPGPEELPPAPDDAALIMDCRNQRRLPDGQPASPPVRPPGYGFVLGLIDNTEIDKNWAFTTGFDDVLSSPFTILDLHLKMVSVLATLDQRRELFRLRGRAEEAERELSRLRAVAYTDHLTGLSNRLALKEWADTALPSRTEPLAIQIMDLDGFKQVNDRHGHAAGDAVLRKLGERLAAIPRRTDMIVRLGGDEIAVVQMNAERPEDCAALADRLLAAVAAPFLVDGQSIQLTASFGSALFPADARTLSELLSQADRAMYAAKSVEKPTPAVPPAPPRPDGLDPAAPPARVRTDRPSPPARPASTA
ncbi:MAG: GGDEF domain-containing protein [Gluconacetobacter diazotrophicus]|nr:GGDEF domain-containing protein [Gluconacetobacter diazotrophicus]